MIIAALALVTPPVLLPKYRQSDAFIYSDGRVERVVKVNRGMVTWSGLSGPSYVRSHNFIEPIAKWRSQAGVGKRTIFGKPLALWPFVGPKSTRFRVVTETRRKPDAGWKRSVTLWTCQTLKPRQVTLALGSYATIPFKCDRYSATNMRLLERIEWDYAPDIGHYVRRSSIDYIRSTRRTVELIAALTGPSANPRRLAAIARAVRKQSYKIDPPESSSQY